MGDRRPVVLVDQDGPLADFDRQFYALCAENGWAMHSTLETQCHRFATSCILDRKHERLARRHVDSSRWFLDLPTVPGALEGMEALAERADVWIVTKPLEANLTCRDDKATWVRTHLGKHWEDRLILAPDKSLVRGDLLLDDALKRVWFRRATWRPVVFPTPWNGEGSEWSDLARWTWADGIDALLGLVIDSGGLRCPRMGEGWTCRLGRDHDGPCSPLGEVNDE